MELQGDVMWNTSISKQPFGLRTIQPIMRVNFPDTEKLLGAVSGKEVFFIKLAQCLNFMQEINDSEYII